MIYLIDEETGSVYYHDKENDEIIYCPMMTNNTFDSEDECVVDIWESKETEKRIKDLLLVK